jgi:hypothetical protein
MAPQSHHHQHVPRRASTTSPRARLLVLLAIVAVVGLVYKATINASPPLPSTLSQVHGSNTVSSFRFRLPSHFDVDLPLFQFHSTKNHALPEVSPQLSARCGLPPAEACAFLRNTMADRAGMCVGSGGEVASGYNIAILYTYVCIRLVCPSLLLSYLLS